MKKKFVFSVAIVMTLAALSAVVFASSLYGMPADEISEQSTVSETAAITQPETTAEPKLTAEEDFKEKPTEEPYQSIIASMDWDADESYLLAKLAMAEAESEDTEGKALVMLVVLNRVWNDEEFPDTIEKVIYQPGQFSPISNGRFDRVEPDEDCWAALDLIMQDKWDESHGATYFESKSESTWHSENLTFLFRHGKHYFYKDREDMEYEQNHKKRRSRRNSWIRDNR